MEALRQLGYVRVAANTLPIRVYRAGVRDGHAQVEQQLRRTALAPCDHPDDELCEHRSAALDHALIEQRARFNPAALLGWIAVALTMGLIWVLAVISIAGWLFP